MRGGADFGGAPVRSVNHREVILAKSSYSFERLQREKEKAATAEAKRQKRLDNKAAARATDGTETNEASEGDVAEAKE